MKLIIYYYSYDNYHINITTVYSRDLSYKETMMESIMKLPDDMYRQEILPYLTVNDIVKLDSACMNHKYRPQLLDKINGVILLGDKGKSIKASLFKWLGIRRIYLINMNLLFEDNSSLSSSIENDYVDQFRYTQHVVIRGPIYDDMPIFILSHSPCLLSIVISSIDYELSADPQITDYTLQSIAEHCTGLQSLSLSCCEEITDAGLITISEHFPDLKSLEFYNCHQITDASIISISTHCTELQLLTLERCRQITDASIISISTHCTELQSLNLRWCPQITDASIISISTHYNGLQSLHLCGCFEITDASIISISIHCTGLQSLNLGRCHHITDISIILISESYTGLKELDIRYTAKTDASLIAIAKNCTGLQNLRIYGCDGLSNYKLFDEFESVSELRATLLSIYPSLPI